MVVNHTGVVTLGAAIDTGAGSLSVTGASIAGSGTLTVGGGLTTDTSSSSGNQSLTASGTVSITSFNAGSGTIALNAGTFSLGGSNVINSNTLLNVSGGTLAMAGNNDTVAGVLLTSGNITGTTGTLTSTSDYQLESGTVGAILGGSVGLTKSTAGTLALNAANTFTGGVTIISGIVALGNATALGPASSAAVNFGAYSTGKLQLNGHSVTLIGLNTSPGVGTPVIENGASGSVTLTVNDTAANIYAGVLQDGAIGTLALAKSGAGTLRVSGANTYSGGTTITAGTLQLGNSAALGTGSVTLAGGVLDINGLTTNDIGSLSGVSGTITNNGGSAAVLQVEQTAAGVFSGTLQNGSNTLALTLDTGSSNTLTLSGANAYTGGTTITAGTLRMGNSAALGTGSLTLGGGTLDVNGLTTDDIGSLSGSGTITNNGGSAAVLKVQQTAAGLFSGTLQDGSNTLALTLDAGSSNTLTLSGANTFSGGTTIRAGTLQMGNAAALGTGRVTLGGGTLDVNGLTTSDIGSLSGTSGTITNDGGSAAVLKVEQTTAGVFSGTLQDGSNTLALTLDTGSSNTLTLGGANTFSGGTTIMAGALRMGNAGALGTGSVTLAGGVLDINGLTTNDIGSLSGSGTITNDGGSAAVLQVKQTAAGVFSGTLQNGSNTLALTLDTGSSNTLTLSGANTFSGGTTITAGTLRMGNAAALGTGSVTLGGGTLDVNGLTTSDIGSLSGTSGTITNDGGSAAVLKVEQTTAGVFSGTLQDGSNTLALTLDTGSSNTLTLGGANTFSGGTTIMAGALRMGNAGALGTGSVTLAGGVLDINGLTTNDIGSLSGSGTITNDGGSAAVLQVKQTAAGVFSGTLQNGSNTLALTLDTGSSNTLTLSGANTFSGGTTITAGTLRMGNAAALGTGRVTLAGGVLDINGLTTNDIGSLSGTSGTITNTGGSAAVLNVKQTAAGVFSGTLQNGSNTLALTLDSGSSNTLTLSGANTYTGGTTITAGTLQLGNGGTTGSLSAGSAIIDNASLAFDRSNTITEGTDFAGVITGSGGIVQSGAGGTLVLSGANTFSGGTTITAGTLQMGNAAALGTGTVALAGGTLDVNGLTTNDIGSLSGSGTITNNGGSAAVLKVKQTAAGVFSGTLQNGSNTLALTLDTGSSNTLTLSGASTFSGGTTITAGTLRMGNAAALGTGSVTLGGGTLDINGLTTNDIGSLSGSGTITNNGGSAAVLQVEQTAAGVFSGMLQDGSNTLALTLDTGSSNTLTLSGANTFSGGTTIAAGTLQMGNVAALGTGSVTLAGGVLDINGLTTNDIGSLSGTSGTITNNGGSAAVLNVKQTAAGVFSGTLQNGSNTLALSLDSGSSNTLTLSGANTFSGGTTIMAGTLQMGNVAALGTGSVTLAGGVLDINGLTTNDIGSLSGSGTITNNGGSAAVLKVKQTAAGVFSGTLQNGSNTLALTLDTGSSNTLTLSGANTFSGGTTITSGTLQMGNAAALGTGTVALAGGTLDVNGLTTNDIGSLSGSGTITNNGGSAAVLNVKQTAAGVFSGTLQNGSNTLALTLDSGSSNTLTLSGANTYTGGTTITAGTLQLGNGGTTGSLSAGSAIIDNASLAFDRSNTITEGTDFAGVITGSGGIVQSGAGGTLVLSGANTFSGGTTITAGTLQMGNAAALGTGTVALAGGTLDVNGLTTNDIGSLSGSGTITNNGGLAAVLKVQQTAAGVFSGTLQNGSNTLALTLDSGSSNTLTLSGASTFSGGTTITAGTLRMGNAAALGAGSVTLGGGTLDINGLTTNDIGSLSGSGTITNNGGSAAVLQVEQTAAGVFSGMLQDGSNTLALTLDTGSSNTLTLGGANTYSGGTMIAAGTLQMGNVAALGTGSVTLAGGTLDINGLTTSDIGSLSGTSGTITNNGGSAAVLQVKQTAAGLFSGTLQNGSNTLALTLDSGSSNTLTLGGANTYSGGTTIAAGTLQLGNAGALGTGAVTLAGGTLDVNGLTTNDIGSLSGSGTITNSNSTANAVLTIKQTADGTFSGTMQDGTRTLALTLDTGSTNTLTLSGNNTYSGGTTISAGTLQLGSASALGAAAGVVDVGSGAVLDLNGQAVTNANPLTLNGTGTGGGALINSSAAAAAYAGPVSLASDSSLGGTGAGTLTLGGVVSGAFNLGKVGSDTLILDGSNSFGSGKEFTIDAGTVQLGNASGLGSAASAVSVANGAVLDLNGQTVGNANPLTLNGTGIAGGGALINSSPTAAAYAGTVSLAGDSSLGGGSLTLNGTLDGAFNLTKLGAGTLTLGGEVGDATPLASLTVAAGATVFEAPGSTTATPSVQTTGSQTYGGAVDLQSDTVLASTGGGVVTFNATVDGPHALEVDSAGNEVFNGRVGGSTPLTSLTSDAAYVGGDVIFNVAGTTAAPSVQTSGGQSYRNAAQLQQDAVLTSTAGGNISFALTVDGAHALEVDTTGNEVFNGVVGGAVPLTSLTTDAASLGGQAQFNMTAAGGSHPAGVNAATVTINNVVVFDAGSSTTAAPSVQTTGAQTYNGAAQLQLDTVLASTGGGAVTFNATVDGARALEVDTAGNEVFNGRVGGSTALASLTTDAADLGGDVIFNAAGAAATPSVQTAGSQTYNDAALLQQPTVLTSVSGGVTFNATVDGARTFSIVSGAGGVAFGADVGGATALRSITVDTSGLIHIAQGASLRTSNGGVVSAVSNFPPRLRLNPPNPSLPLTNANPVQTVTGTLGGDPANYPGDNTETGANFHLVVVWADGVTARNPAGVIINAGDSVTLTVNQEGTIQQWVVTPGTGQGPVNLTLVHPYSFAFLATVGAKVKVTVTVTNDPSIHLKDAQTTAQNDLGQAQASVSTPVAGNDFEAPALPPAFVEPAAIVVAAPQVVPATNQADTLQVARVEYAPVQTGKVEEQTAPADTRQSGARRPGRGGVPASRRRLAAAQ